MQFKSSSMPWCLLCVLNIAGRRLGGMGYSLQIKKTQNSVEGMRCVHELLQQAVMCWIDTARSTGHGGAGRTKKSQGDWTVWEGLLRKEGLAGPWRREPSGKVEKIGEHVPGWGISNSKSTERVALRSHEGENRVLFWKTEHLSRCWCEGRK